MGFTVFGLMVYFTIAKVLWALLKSANTAPVSQPKMVRQYFTSAD
jgi:hypothetical protein